MSNDYIGRHDSPRPPGCNCVPGRTMRCPIHGLSAMVDRRVRDRRHSGPSPLDPLSLDKESVRRITNAVLSEQEEQAKRLIMGGRVELMPTPLADCLTAVIKEVQASSRRPLPTDHLRRAALVAEEAGEVIKAALDLTRPSSGPLSIDEIPAQVGRRLRDFDSLTTELTHTAAMALQVLVAMKTEKGDPIKL